MVTTGTNTAMANTPSLILYPNPTGENTVTIYSESNLGAGALLEIHNTLGELIKSERLAQNQQQLYVGDLSSGVYVVSVKSNNQNYCQKLIIQH